ELPGTDKRLAKELMYVSGHVDAVRDTVGANDDASGTVFMMEVARLLRETPLRRTVRFVGYGVEERLSVGAYRHYQNRARNGMAAAVFGYNADSCGAKLGVNRLTVTGPAALERLTRKLIQQTGYVSNVESCVTPYSDQFALNMLGVPTLWVHRVTNTSGDWCFHSTHDNLNAVDAGKIAEQAAFAAEMLRAIDGAKTLPFEVKLPPAQWKEVAALARQLIGIDLKPRG
ncbi:MAG TPA: M28 family peptidase, partial [Candidatus Brocadiia bacterium]|nr:M28 family peptidase [Candidatus Brocadiia bacterium]